ncbi:MAG: hypothetical protein IKZ16_05300 [Clostridia bacterium]|nr:hypothetical protein [Clostridia bacterium]
MEDRESDVLMCRAQYAVHKNELTVCLYACRAGIAFEYALEITQGDLSERCGIGRDVELARRLFYKILTGGVTACHLGDVIGDELFATM